VLEAEEVAIVVEESATVVEEAAIIVAEKTPFPYKFDRNYYSQTNEVRLQLKLEAHLGLCCQTIQETLQISISFFLIRIKF